MAEGFVQVAPDSSGKAIDNDVVTVPAGTVVTAADGSTSVLSAPAYYFRQRIVNADPNDPVALAAIRRGQTVNADDYGLVVRQPGGNPDLEVIKWLLTDIDTNMQALAMWTAQPPPQTALPMVGGLLPSQLSPTLPRPVAADVFGRQVVIAHTVPELVASQATTITSSTAETTIITASADAIVCNDVAVILVTNTSATATRVDIRDQLSTVANPASQHGVIPLYVPAGEMRGFCPPVLVKQSNPNQAWTATCGTSVADIRIWALYAKNKRQ